MKRLDEISVGFSSDPQLGKLKSDIEVDKIFIRHVALKPLQHFASYFTYALSMVSADMTDAVQQHRVRLLQTHASNLSKQASQIQGVLSRFKGDKFALDLKRDRSYYDKALKLVEKFGELHSTLEVFLYESSRMTFEVMRSNIADVVELFFQCLVLMNDLGGFEGLSLLAIHVRGMQKDLKLLG